MKNKDSNRGRSINTLGELVLPISRTVDQIIKKENYRLNNLDQTKLATIRSIIGLTSSYVQLWDKSVPREIYSKAFSNTYSHEVCGPMAWVQTHASLLHSYSDSSSLIEGPSDSEIEQTFKSMIGNFRDHVKRLGLLLTAELGIFDESTLKPDWDKSLPESILVYDASSDNNFALTRKEFLSHQGKQYSLEKRRWECFS